MRFLTLILLCLSACYAADPPLPADAQKVVSEYEQAVAKAKAVYDAAVAKAGDKAAKDLDTKGKELAKKGDLDGAIAVKAKADDLKSGKLLKDAEQRTDEATNGIQVLSARYGIEGQYVDVTKAIIAKIKDGKLDFAHEDDVTAAFGDPAPGATKSIVITYRFGKAEPKTVSFPKHARVSISPEP